VRKQLRSKEEQARYERKQLEDEYSKKLADSEARAVRNEQKFVDLLINRALQDAAVTGDAFQRTASCHAASAVRQVGEEKPMIVLPGRLQ